MKRPKATPDKKMGDKTLGEMIDYYNNELMVEAKAIVEYKAYIDGIFDSVDKSRDFSQLDFLEKEINYYHERLEFLTNKMTAIRKVMDMLERGLK